MRLNGPHTRWRNLTQFADALKRSHLRYASPSTVSRWETGRSAITFDAVRGYENLLGVSPNSVVAVLDTIFRYRAPLFGAAPMLVRRADQADIGDLMDKAGSDAVMRGTDWDALTAFISVRPELIFQPQHVWEGITHRLLAEVMVADGISWLHRFEALNRVLAHPSLGGDALAALRTVVGSRSVQSLVGTACLFDASAEPDASAEVLRHLVEPSDPRVFKGALMACVRKLNYRHFTAPQLERLADRLAAILLDPAHHDADTRALAVYLIRRLPARSHGREASTALRRVAREPIASTILRRNRLVEPENARLVAERVAGHATARLPTMTGGYVDDVLPSLVEEMLFDPIFDVRLYAAFLISVSPYRPTVAEALTTELDALRPPDDPVLLTGILEGLRRLGGQDERHRVEQYVTRPDLPETITDVAAYALGHIGGQSADRYWRHAFGHHLAAWERSASPAVASVLDRLVYAMGRAGREEILRAVRQDHRVPGQVRDSARWWLDQPATVMESARI